MQILKVLFFPFIILSCAITHAKTTTLMCETENFKSKNQVSISVIFDEKNKTANINGDIFRNVQFTETYINGSKTIPISIEELVKESRFSLNRITGSFFVDTMTIIKTDSKLSDSGLDKYLETSSHDQMFVGTCKKTSPKF